MLPGARTPYGNRPFLPGWPHLVLTTVGILILALFVVDKLVVAPPAPPSSLVAVIDHLNRHDVRRMTIPAQAVTIELNDGKTLTTRVTADRDLWPAIRRSGADVTIVPGTSSADRDTSPMGYVLGFVPFIIMALLLLFVLRTFRRSRLQ